MTVTLIYAETLRAALKRQGVWLVNLRGMPTEFYHKTCFPRIARGPATTGASSVMFDEVK